MQKSLGVPTHVFDPFARVVSEQLSPEVKTSSAIFTAALGLAIP
jgi:Tfp pilus assembly PilM family ATPase